MTNPSTLVTLSDLPEAITLNTPVPQTPVADKMAVSWDVSTDTYFQCYCLYRSTSPGMDTPTLVTTIYDPGENSFMDSKLNYTTTYYYQVYVVNLYDAYQGSNVASAKTSAPGGVVGFPFSDDMESVQGYWIADSPWGLSDAISHSGSYSWSESPQWSYGNNLNASLQFSINLLTTRMPALTYWQRYSLELNKDYDFLKISTDGGANWTRLSYITGNSAVVAGCDENYWIKEQVDLAEYVGLEKIIIRFRFVSDGSGISDGWYIDDVSLGEPEITIPYPFMDTMDNEQTKDNWCSSSWELNTNSHSAPYGWTDSPMGNYLLLYPYWLKSCLTLAGSIDLSEAEHPQLIFWHHYDMYYYDNYCYYRCYGLVEVSGYCGQPNSWRTLWDSRNYASDRYSIQSEWTWTRVQLDLSAYAGLPQVRVRFTLWGQGCSNYHSHPELIRDGWYIDDVVIAEPPQDVTLAEPVNTTMHGTRLSWTPSSHSAFSRYEIYRSTSASVDRSSTLVATIDDQHQTSFDDSYSIIQPDYYYLVPYILTLITAI